LMQMHHKNQIQLLYCLNPVKKFSIPLVSHSICFHPHRKPTTLASIPVGIPRSRDPHPMEVSSLELFIADDATHYGQQISKLNVRICILTLQGVAYFHNLVTVEICDLRM